MKGAIVVIVALLLLPGSIIMLLSANFGAVKGYLIGATCFFGFLTLLTFIWTFGLPGTVPLTGPVGPEPTFRAFTADSPKGQEFDKVNDFQGGEGNGWQAEPQNAPQGDTLKEDLEAARQALVADFIAETNKGVKDSSKEVDVINLDAKTYYTIQNGTEVAAVVISPKDPPKGSGLVRPTFQPVTVFAYRDPGFPNLYNYIVMAGALLLTALHILLLARAERRHPLGQVRAPTEEPRQTAGTGARG